MSRMSHEGPIDIITKEYKARYDYDDFFSGTKFSQMTLESQGEFYHDLYLLQNGETLDTVTPRGALDQVRALADFQEAISNAGGNITVPIRGALDYMSPVRSTVNGGGYRSATPDDLPEVNWISLLKSKVLTAINYFSPLVLDLDGDGVETTSLTGDHAVYFDHGQDSYAEASGWVAGGDGLLAIDLNDDGVINNGSELFGDQTGERNGFEVLAEYDSNADGKISGEDVVWSDLRVWVDANGDGYSQSSELKTLDSLGITQINLAYTDVNTTNNGNTIKENGSFVIGANTRTVSDVYFAVDKTNSIYDGEITGDNAQAFYISNLRGYGSLKDLSLAMYEDNDNVGNLLEKVATFSSLSFANLFSADGTSLSAVKDILFRWAGVEGVVSGSRGLYVDAQELAFLEALTGEPFLQRGIYSNPYSDAGDGLSQAFDEALNGFFARLAIQGAGKDLFTGDVVYNMATDVFEGITGLNLTTLDTLETEATALSSTAARSAFWADVVRVIEYGTTLGGTDATALNTAIHDSDSSLTLAGIEALLVADTAITTFSGTSGADTLTGTSTHDVLNGGAGNDTLYGLANNDTLNGDGGTDTLVGGTGGDLLQGGFDSDTYQYTAGDGYDVIDETGGTADRILFGAGISSSDITLTRAGLSDLVITIGGSTPGEIIVKDQFTGSNNVIETIEFASSSTITLSSLNMTQYGTSGADTLVGVSVGAGTNDTLYGGDGNDTISGGAGDDTLYGDAGKDIIDGGNNNDTIHGGSDNDVIHGGGGNNILYGDAGDDIIDASTGNDAFYFTSGNDTYTDTGGADTIYIPSGFTSSSTIYYKLGNDLKIILDATNSILVKNQFAGNTIETINFNGTPMALSSVTTITQGDDANNTLSGSTGIDTLYGMGGNDTISGGAGNDKLYGGIGNDTLNGDGDNDFLDGGAGDDTVLGGAGNDTYYYVSGHDYYEESSGTDTVEFAAGWTLADLSFRREVANPNNLLIVINASNSVLLKYEFSAATYTFETLKFSDASTLNLNTYQYATYGTAAGETINGIAYNASLNDTIYAGGGNDIVYGSNGNDTLYGEDGNDTLNGDNDNDYMDGGAGNDTLKGSYGNDTYVFSGGNDTFEDYSTGTDIVKLGAPWTLGDLSFSRSSATPNDLLIQLGANDSILLKYQFSASGSYNFETLQFSDNTTLGFSSLAVTTNGTSGNDTISGILYNASTNDTIYGLGGTDTLYGGNGNDTLYGGDGNDTLNGEANDDYLDGGTGNDTLNGAAGNDTYAYSAGLDSVTDTGGTDTVKIFGATINDLSYTVSGNNVTLIIHSGTDQILVNNLANVSTTGHIEAIQFDDGFQTTLEDYASWTFGTSGADTLTGTSAHNTLIGRAGNDTLDGAGGNDNIHGGAGLDTVKGGAGDDLVHGGEGNDLVYGQDGTDTLYGGTGNDTFVFEAASAFNNIDTIRDYSNTDDAIDIKDLLTGYTSGTSDIADFVSLTTSGGNTSMLVDRDGASATYSAQSIVTLSGVTGLDIHEMLTNNHLIAS